MSTQGTQPTHEAQPSEEELRKAYEAELSRITTGDMILQSAASLLNIGGLRLGLVQDVHVERDLEQVRDAIDAVRALLPIIERHDARQLGPLRDALAQLQMAYTRELQAAAEPSAGQPPAGQPSAGQASAERPSAGQSSAEQPQPKPEGTSGPGPAESSGRLWVPGR